MTICERVKELDLRYLAADALRDLFIHVPADERALRKSIERRMNKAWDHYNELVKARIPRRMV